MLADRERANAPAPNGVRETASEARTGQRRRHEVQQNRDPHFSFMQALQSRISAPVPFARDAAQVVASSTDAEGCDLSDASLV